LLGKKVKRLRREGLIPGNVVEPLKASIAIQVAERELASLVRHGGSGHLVDLIWEDETQPVLVDHVEIDAITDRLVHATFRRVDLTKPVTVPVPVRLEGRAPASELPDCMVIQLLSEIDVSALPTEIPSYLVAEATGLAEVGDEVRVADLRAVDGVFEAVTDSSEVVAAVQVTRITEEEEEAEEAELEEVELGAEEEAAVEEEAAPEPEADEQP
jgi:large subunit ribosomal protein L25